MENLIIVLLGFQKMIGLTFIGFIQLIIILTFVYIAGTITTCNKYWFKNTLKKIQNWID